jgi:fructose/tagatose bisphosphate aldolase
MKARQHQYAVGAFNIYNLEGALAVVSAAEELNSPVILQVLPSALRIGGNPLIALCLEAGRKTAKSTAIPLVLHGTSGLPDHMITTAIELGISKFNVNTEIRSAYLDSIQATFRKNPTIELISLMQICIEAMVSPIKSKIRLFGSVDKANI